MWEDLDGFAQYLLKNDRRKTTILKHINCLKILRRFHVAQNYNEVTTFLLQKKEQGTSNSYLNNFINSIRLYSQYKGLGEDLSKYKQFKKVAGIKSTLSDEEIEAFLALPRPKGASSQTFHIYTVFFSICAFTGMRPGEVAHLKISDVDFGRGVFNITQSKTNQPGISPIPANIKLLVEEHIKTVEGEYLFPSKFGGSKHQDGVAVIDNVDWHYNFHKRIKILGIKRPRLTPYSFRHSFATRLLEENISLFHVKKLMRHNDLKSTLVYEHLTTKDLIQAVEKLPLVRKGTSPKNILQSIAELIKTFHIEKDDRFHYRLEENDHSVRFEVHLKSFFWFFLCATCATLQGMLKTGTVILGGLLH